MFSLSEKKKKELISESDKLLSELFPLCRSLTGEGLRTTLKKLNEITSFKIKEFKSGKEYYDWKIPDEWIIREAFIRDSKGNKIIDFKDNNLHVVNYSNPIKANLNYFELKQKIHILADLKDAIPYRTAYYSEDWGFCMSSEDFKKLDKNDTYEVLIDSEFKKGVLNYGEHTIRGRNPKRTYIFTSYPCHPSLANDNLSGIILWTLLLRELKKLDLENNYIFAIHPETIGAIAYLKTNEKKMKKVEAGSVLTTVAGPGKYSIKKSFLQNSIMDRVNLKTFKDFGVDYIEYDFDPDAGSDERQYSSQYFGIPMTSICKDKYFEYDFYHTSKDNLDFISSIDLIETLNLYLSSISKLERNFIYKSLNPKCEPMLGKRGLYPSIGGQLKQNSNKDNNDDDNSEITLSAINWLMYLCDGKNDILDIAERTNLNFDLVSDVAQLLEKNKLLKRLNK